MSTNSAALANFGRAWNINITTQRLGQTFTLASAGAVPALRVMFTAKKYIHPLTTVWDAEITIYNLSSWISAAIANKSGLSAFYQSLSQGTPLSLPDTLAMGDIVDVSAGYQAPNANTFSAGQNLVWSGNVLQAIVTRESVTDTKLQLHCVSNLAASAFAFCNFARSSDLTDLDVVNQILTNTGLTIQSIDAPSQEILQARQYSRGQVIFDRPFALLADIARQNNLLMWFQTGLNVRSLASSWSGTLTPRLVYASPFLKNIPSNALPTIIGTPQQTQEGVTFRVLMDSQVQLGDVIQIASGTVVTGYQFGYGQLPPFPNTSGTYIVGGLRYVGDTRGSGSDWYTEITGVTQKKLLGWAVIRSIGSLANLAASRL